MNQLDHNQSQINDELEELWALVDEEPAYVTQQLEQLETKRINADIKSKCHIVKSFLNLRKNELTQTAQNIYQAKSLVTIMQDVWYVRLLRVQAGLNFYLGNQEQQFQCLKENLEKSLMLGIAAEICPSYINLGYYYATQSNLRQASEHILKAEAYIYNDRSKIAFHVNLGWVYLKQKAFQESESEFLIALDLCQANKIFRYSIFALHRLAELEFSRNCYQKGISYCQQGIALAHKHKESAVHLELMLGEFFLAEDKLEDAESFALKALESFENEKHEAQASAHELLSRIYKHNCQYKKALEHFEKHSFYKNEQVSTQSLMKQKALEVIYETEVLKREKETIELKNRELQSYIQELEILNEKVKELSIRDALTGLYNRRYLFEQAENILKLSRRYGRSLTVVMLDIDHFKSINDRFFHATGDLVLKIVAQLLQAGLRDADPIARYGGEEFAILLPETALAGAVLACERLRKSIEYYDWSSIHADLKVTVSIGLASDTSCETVEALFSLADAQLYEAKRSGRNKLAYAQKSAAI